MVPMSRWLAPALLAAGLGATALFPAPARAQDDAFVRVLVDVADVVLRGGVPYYRHGDYGYADRLVVARDRHGRPVYYRTVPRYRHDGPPYGNAYGYWNNGPGARRVSCNRNGNCTVKYYDPRYDRSRYVRYDRHRDGRWRDDRRRWRDRDD